MKSWLAIYGISSLVTVAAHAAADGGRARRPEFPPSNEFGEAVRTPSGSALLYERGELEAQGALRAPASAAERAPAGLATEGPIQRFTYASFGEGIGLAGISTASVNGRTEIYAGASVTTFGRNNYWYALALNPAAGGYDMVYVSPLYASTIVRLDVADVRAEPGPEIVALLEDGTVEVRSAASKQVLTSFPTSLSFSFFGGGALRFFDLDGDGLDEVWVTGESQARAFRGTGALAFGVDGAGGDDLVVAQLDNDPGPELATADGKVVDVTTGAVQCTWADGFGFRLAASDFDHDGKRELVFAEPWGFVWGFNADTCLPAWSLPAFNTGAFAVVDVDGDGGDELLLGDAQWGGVHAHSLATQQELWSIDNPEHGTTWVAVADTDGDGDREVLWGAGASSTGPDRLYVGDPGSAAITWENVQLEGPFVGPRVGDVDGDGAPEIVAVSATSDAGYGSGRIVVLDAQTLQVKAVSQPIAQGLGWTGIHDVKLRNVDADPALEIVTAAGTTYDGLIEIYDYAPSGAFPLKWDNNTLPYGATFYSVDVADVDGDGGLDVVGGVGIEHTGGAGLFTYVYDYDTGAELWHSLHMGSSWGRVGDLALADSDGDGHVEIHAMVVGGPTYVFDGASKELQAIVGASLRAIDVRPAPGGHYLWAGDEAGRLTAYAWNGTTYAKREAYQLVTGAPLEAFTFGASNAVYAASGGGLSYRHTLTSPPSWSLSGWGAGFGQNVAHTRRGSTFITSNAYGIFAFDEP